MASTGIFRYVTLKLSFNIGRGIIDGTIMKAFKISQVDLESGAAYYKGFASA